jgi:hypothetical protein
MCESGRRNLQFLWEFGVARELVARRSGESDNGGGCSCKAVKVYCKKQ